MKPWFRIYFDEAGDGKNGGGAGGGGAPSLVTPPAGGGQGGAAGGNEDPSKKAGGEKPAGDPNAGGAPAGNNPPDWRSSLPKELQEDATLKKYASPADVAQALVNATKLIGKNKIVAPDKHTTDEQWNDIYKSLGLPELEKYDLKFGEGASIDEAFVKDFKEKAHKAGILPKQAQQLADWFTSVNKGAEGRFASELKAQGEKNVAALKQEWGNSFDLQVSRANKVIEEMGGPDLAKLIVNTGLGTNPVLFKALAKVGETLYAEHKFVEGQTGTAVLNPKELGSKIKELQANPAYFDKQHPQHKTIVDEVRDLFEKRHPAVDKK